MPRERMRDLELPAYMRALVEAREKWMDESSGRLNEHIEHLEWIDELAVALGISVDAEDWWDSTVPAKRAKIMGRISVLRGLRPALETSVARIPVLPISAEDEATVDALVARRVKETRADWKCEAPCVDFESGKCKCATAKTFSEPIKGVVSGSDLERQIQQARKAIAGWPDDVKRAMKIQD